MEGIRGEREKSGHLRYKKTVANLLEPPFVGSLKTNQKTKKNEEEQDDYK